MSIQNIVEIVGTLVSALKAYAARLPAVASAAMTPSAIKPSPEAVTAYEQAVLRFRKQAVAGASRGMNDLFLESLEAFEGGRLLGAVQPLLQVLDHLEALQRDQSLTLPPGEAKRLVEYRQALNRILPGNQPELEGAGKGL